MTDASQLIRWGHHALGLESALGEDGTARLTRIGAPGAATAGPHPDAPLPLVEVTVLGHGRHWSGRNLIDTEVGKRLRYRAHDTSREGDWHVPTCSTRPPPGPAPSGTRTPPNSP